jgi:hypothetical protein
MIRKGADIGFGKDTAMVPVPASEQAAAMVPELVPEMIPPMTHKTAAHS